VPAQTPHPTPQPNKTRCSFLRFKRLQNTFDLRGVALPPTNGNGAKGKEEEDAVTLSPVEAYFLGQAFATWLRLQQGDDEGDQQLTVAVGRDSRLTGPALSRAVLDGVEAVRPGAALDLGLCSTPGACAVLCCVLCCVLCAVCCAMLRCAIESRVARTALPAASAKAPTDMPPTPFLALSFTHLPLSHTQTNNKQTNKQTNKQYHPAAFHACLPPPLGLSARGSVEVTASHLPPDRNGLKLFARRRRSPNGSGNQNHPNHQHEPEEPGGLEEADIDDLIVLAAKLFSDQHGAYPNLDLPTNRPHPSWRARHDFLPDVYGAHLARLIRGGGNGGDDTTTTDNNDPHPLKGLRIVVNPGHGAGGFFLGVLASCGADTGGSLNVHPDGRFPSGNPNPEDPMTMRATVEAVAAQGADLGIVFVRGLWGCGGMGVCFGFVFFWGGGGGVLSGLQGGWLIGWLID
jgi:hypothetical protein